MKVFCFAVTTAAMVFSLAQPTQARAADKGDVYFGYSRVGANLYGPNTAGMNGWQGAFHFKAVSVFGAEVDLSHYGQSPSGFSEHVTNLMLGPRATLRVRGFSAFAHALAGFDWESATVTTLPSTSYSAASLAVGGGADFPLFLGFKLRVSGDYLANSKAPSSGSPSPSHYRFGVGVAYHF